MEVPIEFLQLFDCCVILWRALMLSTVHLQIESLSIFSGTPLHIHNSQCSWNQHYAVLSFLLSGHLYTEYARLSGWLGLPPCSNTQWHRIVEKLEPCVTQLAEWSCDQVRQRIMERGDGFNLTRGHYSNNASATLHDFITNMVHPPNKARTWS